MVATVIGCGSQAAHRTHRTGSGGSAATGIPPALQREARPIGRGPGFHPPVSGPIVGRCRSRLGPRDGVHVELFAANRVVLLAAGIGTRPPLRFAAGRIARAACYGDLVTLEPTGVVLVRAGARMRLADLFRSWGEPLSSHRLASFRPASGKRVLAYVGGRPWRQPPGRIPLRRHAEVVVEVGPPVAPHSRYTFPPGS